MKFKFFLCAFLAAAALMPAAAQSTESAKKAHKNAHKELLAKNQSKMDLSSIDNQIKNDVIGREASVALDNPLANDILAEGFKHLGKPYVHGAKGPRQFDCSGFTSYVYKQFGYSISPSSRMQYTQGTAVKRNDLRKGDLVFFTSRSSGKNVGHVGIVVSADNETGKFSFVHASIHGVKVSNFEGYYASRYIGARRILPTE